MFQERGLRVKIDYQKCLSRSRNPDFVVRHPNETVERNKQNWEKEIEKRVRHEEDLRLEVLRVRLAKRTGESK